MPWTAASIGTAGRFSGAAEAQVDPAWQPWLDLLEIALEEDGREWTSAVRVRENRPPDAPLLDGAALRLDARRATALVLRAAHVAGMPGDGKINAPEAIRASIARDEEALALMSERAAMSIDTFAVLAQVAAMPLLLAAARMLHTTAASKWNRGYCPVCGAWPSMAEVRGIERTRQLRCGRCSADWPLALLRCAFCDEQDHEKLGMLLPEGEEQLKHVETCESCHGYLKVMTTVDALPVRALLVLDLTTIPLDFVAHDRGYARPARPGWAPNVETAP